MPSGGIASGGCVNTKGAAQSSLICMNLLYFIHVIVSQLTYFVAGSIFGASQARNPSIEKVKKAIFT